MDDEDIEEANYAGKLKGLFIGLRTLEMCKAPMFLFLKAVNKAKLRNTDAKHVLGKVLPICSFTDFITKDGICDTRIRAIYPTYLVLGKRLPQDTINRINSFLGVPSKKYQIKAIRIDFSEMVWGEFKGVLHRRGPT